MPEPKIILQVIRCTSANRTSYIPVVGEFMFETNTSNLYIGDGVTAGGIIVSSSTGFINDGANVGTAGIGIFKQKSGATLQFKKLNAGSNKVTITDDTGNDEVDVDINESNFTSVIMKSIADTKGDIIVATANDSISKLAIPLTNPEEYQLIPDTSEVTGLKWAKRLNNEVILNYKNASTYTVDLLNDHVIVGIYNASDMIFTFGDPSVAFTVGHPGREYIFKNGDTTGKILTVKLYGTGTFQNGLNEIKLYNRDTLRMGYIAPNIADGAFLLQKLLADAQCRRNISWSASNFTSPTAIPFDTNDHIHDSNIIDHSTTTNSTRITCKVKGELLFHYWFGIDSTGGGSYNITSYLRKNGTTIIPGSYARSGNYQTEDTSVNVGSIYVDANINDYFEVIIDNNNLTGNLVDAVVNIRGSF